MLDKAIRELDRERMGLQQQEKKTIVEIKKMAKEGQMVRAAVLCAGPQGQPSAARVCGAVCGVAPSPALCVCVCPGTHVMDPQDAVKVMAKSLIRNRHAVTKLHGLKSQLQAVSLRIQVRVWAFVCVLLCGVN